MSGTVMRMEKENTGAAVRSVNHSVRREDRTEIPTQLKGRMKQNAKSAFDDVPVHYNLDMPSRLDALAYTQEKQVEIGRGHQANEIGVGNKVGIIQRMGNEVVQRQPPPDPPGTGASTEEEKKRLRLRKKVLEGEIRSNTHGHRRIDRVVGGHSYEIIRNTTDYSTYIYPAN